MSSVSFFSYVPPHAQVLPLDNGIVASSRSPATILPAGHALGSEAVPLFRKITEEEAAGLRVRWAEAEQGAQGIFHMGRV